jgi:hypothetical protein
LPSKKGTPQQIDRKTNQYRYEDTKKIPRSNQSHEVGESTCPGRRIRKRLKKKM